jgi:DNA repair exonuclease SbcCD ATPase subunit
MIDIEHLPEQEKLVEVTIDPIEIPTSPRKEPFEINIDPIIETKPVAIQIPTQQDETDDDDEDSLAIVLAIEKLVEGYTKADETTLQALLTDVKKVHKQFDQVGRLGVQVAPKESQAELLETFDVLSDVIKDFCEGAQNKLPYDQLKSEAEEIGELIKEILNFLFGQNIEENYDSASEEDSIELEMRELEARLQASDETLSKYRKAVELLNNENNQLKSQLEASDQKVSQSKGNPEHSESTLKEIQKLQKERDDFQSEIDKLKSELAQSKSTTPSGSSENEKKLLAEIENYKTTLADYDKRYSDLDKLLADLNNAKVELSIGSSGNSSDQKNRSKNS